MREWLARFMAGRYGADQFNRFLSIALLVMIGINMFARGRLGAVLSLLTWALFLYSMFRMLSRDHGRRQAENRWYMEKSARFRGWAWQRRTKLEQRRNQKQRQQQQRQSHVFFSCPKCQAQLRLPRGRGNIEITCARCGHKFMGKS